MSDARLQFLRQGFVQVFRVVSATKGEFALRMYSTPPAGSDAKSGASATRLRSPHTLRSQLAWLSALGHETDLMVPEPVPTADGSLMAYASFDDLPLRRRILRRLWGGYRRVYHPHHPGRHCVLLRWVPGEHKGGKDLTARDISLVGSYVAGLHKHAEGYRAPTTAALPRWDWEWAFGEGAPLWGEGEAHYSAEEMGVFRAAARHARADLENLGEGREVFGPIHRDLNFNNVMFGDRSVGAIDFDMSGLGHYLFDLSVVRRVLARRHTDRLEPLWEAFLGGYRRERPLPEDRLRYLATFEAMQQAAAVNRNLGLLADEATRRQARGRGFLRAAVVRLQNDYLRGKG